jgi:hypothetical protein
LQTVRADIAAVKLMQVFERYKGAACDGTGPLYPDDDAMEKKFKVSSHIPTPLH